MKKYMILIRDSETGEQSATFTDDYRKADNMRMDAEVSLGDFAQIYEWLPNPEFPDDNSLYMCSYQEIGG